MSTGVTCGDIGFNVPIINWTPYDWKQTYIHSYQMAQWNWPTTIPAGTILTICIEESGTGTRSDDAGEVTYSIGSTGDSMQFQFRDAVGSLQVLLTSLTTNNLPSGTTYVLNDFILAGTHGNYISNFNKDQLPGSWMHNSLSYIGGRTIRQICVPGAHDSGMSSISNPSAFVNRYNTQTQVYTVKDQLNFGARWLDIRPCITGGVYQTCHGSQQTIAGKQQFFGAYGQTIADVISDINSFTATNPELIMIDISHSFNSDNGGAGFSDSDWYGLFEIMLGLNNRYTAGRALLTNGKTLDQIPVGQIIGGKKAAVMMLVEGEGNLGTYANQGFYTASTDLSTADFPYYNNYANSDSPATVAADQVSKMKSVRTSSTSGEFLLSWQITMTEADSVAAGPGGRAGGGEYSLIEQASLLFFPLFSYGADNFTQNVYPNIILTDAFGCWIGSAGVPHCVFNSTDITALCMAVNYQGLPYC